MKKILFGSAAAICAVVGFSSFKSTTATTQAFWFVPASSGITPNPSGDVFENTDQSISGAIKVVAVDANQSVKEDEPNPCNSTSTHYCKIGFTTAQVTGIGFDLRLKGTAGRTSLNFSLTNL